MGKAHGCVYVATVDYQAGVVSTRIDPAMTNRAVFAEALGGIGRHWWRH